MKCAEKGDYKGLSFNHWVGPQVLQFCYRVIPTVAILYFGQGLASEIIAVFPVDSFVMRALTAIGGMHRIAVNIASGFSRRAECIKDMIRYGRTAAIPAIRNKLTEICGQGYNRFITKKSNMN